MKKNYFISNLTKKLLTFVGMMIISFLYSQNATTPFVTTWKTTDNTIKIPVNTNYTYNYNVKWTNLSNANQGNGEVLNKTGSYTITGLSNNDTYKVEITGTFPCIFFLWESTTDKQKLYSIESWGNNTWQNMQYAFQGCSNLVYNATDIPTLGTMCNFDSMFENCTNFNGNSTMNSWNTANVTSMGGMFFRCKNFNQPLGNWNLSSVTNINSMFQEAEIFNQDLSTWDTSKVMYMDGTFRGAKAFNKPLNSWNTSSVLSMGLMFEGAIAFDQNISSWNVAKVKNFNQMFSGAKVFNQNIGNWNTSSATDMSWMFNGASTFNQNISAWNTSNVINMSFMFSGASVFNQPIGSWNTTAVTNMQYMFNAAQKFNQPIGNWNTSNVTNMNTMFNFAVDFNQDISTWNTSKVTDMSGMFRYTGNFNQNISSWDTSKVTNMANMFSITSKFNQPIGIWDTSSVTNMSDMFSSSQAFNQNISNWNVTNVKSMNSMFFSATAFNQNLGNWKLNSITTNSWENLNNMFDYSGLNCVNYDNTLQGWSQNPSLKTGLNLGAANIKYSSTTGQAARNVLTNSVASGGKGWTISGDIFDAGCAATLSTTYDTMNNKVKIYPNPTPGIVNIILNETAEVQVYSVDGKMIQSQKISKGTSTVDLTSKNAGVYLIKVGNQTYKVIKK